MNRTDLDLDLLRRVADALTPFVCPCLPDQCCAQGEHLGKSKCWNRQADEALTDLRALIARLDEPISTGFPSPVYVDDEPQDREAGVTGPVAYRIRVQSDDPEEWSLMHPEKALDFLERSGVEAQPLYLAPAPQAVDAETAGLSPYTSRAIYEHVEFNTPLQPDPRGEWFRRKDVDPELIEAADTIVALTAQRTAAKAARDEAVRALTDVRTAILEADPEVITDTVWMPDQVCMGSTVVDYIDAAIERAALKAGGPASPSAVDEIAAERRRQIEVEGWTPEHDDQHIRGELAAAAACYAHFGWMARRAPTEWPWDAEWWKPKDRRRDLIRGGALIVAEIERLDRAALKAGGQDHG